MHDKPSQANIHLKNECPYVTASLQCLRRYNCFPLSVVYIIVYQFSMNGGKTSIHVLTILTIISDTQTLRPIVCLNTCGALNLVWQSSMLRKIWQFGEWSEVWSNWSGQKILTRVNILTKGSPWFSACFSEQTRIHVSRYQLFGCMKWRV